MLAQNGAPVRLVVPWKYGYKSAKSIVKIEFIDYRPETLNYDVRSVPLFSGVSNDQGVVEIEFVPPSSLSSSNKNKPPKIKKLST